MGNYLLTCNEPKIEENEIVKSNIEDVQQNYIDAFIKSLKPINIYKTKYKILKPKLTDKLRKEIKKIYNISSFPCGNLILIADEEIIYIYDNKFNFLKKQENNEYKELFIKDDITFITYNKSKIKIWEFIQKSNILRSICIIDTNLLIKKVEIINNDDIIGITDSNLDYEGPYQCFIYKKDSNNIYQKKTIIKYNSWIFSFLINKTNKQLIILYFSDEDERPVIYGHYRIDIYEYKNMKLKRRYGENFHNGDSDFVKNYLFNINDNLFSFIHTDHTPTTCHASRDMVIIYDINKENKISFRADIFIGGKIEYFSSIKAFLNDFYLIGLQINYIYSLLNEKISHPFRKVDYDNIHFSDFFKLNENELCIFDKEQSKIRIYELLG